MKSNLYVGRVLLALVPFLAISSVAQAALANRVFVSQRSGKLRLGFGVIFRLAAIP